MSMERYDPFREMATMRDMMNRMFNDPFFRSPFETMGISGTGSQSLAVDVHEDEKGYTISAALPGVKPEDVNITVNGNTVTLRAQSGGENERRQGNYLVRERRGSNFQRTITLPEQIQTDQVTAHFEYGELVLTLPRAQASRSHQIPVTTGGQSGTAQISEQSDSQGALNKGATSESQPKQGDQHYAEPSKS